MTLSNELMLDATMAGSIGRFVNHSCLPNCETEKWWVPSAAHGMKGCVPGPNCAHLLHG